MDSFFCLTRLVRNRRWRLAYRPLLEALEARLPPDDGVMGLLAGGVLLDPALPDIATSLGERDLIARDGHATALRAARRPAFDGPPGLSASPAASSDNAGSSQGPKGRDRTGQGNTLGCWVAVHRVSPNRAQ
jgi:hypothetical protein